MVWLCAPVTLCNCAREVLDSNPVELPVPVLLSLSRRFQEEYHKLDQNYLLLNPYPLIRHHTLIYLYVKVKSCN